MAKQIAAIEFINQKTPIMGGVYLAIGQDNYLLDQVKQKMLQQVAANERTMNTSVYDLTTTPLNTLLDDALSAPFFGEKRVVVGQNAAFLGTQPQKLQQKTDELAKYLTTPNQTSIVLLLAPFVKLDARKKISKQLKQQAFVIDCSYPNESVVKQQIFAYATSQQVTLDNAAMQLLLTKTGANLQSIMNELPKLVLAAADTHQITEAMVAQLVASSVEENVFELVNLVLAKKTGAALAMFGDLINQQEEPTKLVMLLISQFRLLISTVSLKQRGYSQGAITQTIKVHPYRIKLALRTSRNFKLESLKQAFLGLAELEIKLKTTQQSPQTLFSLFMVRFVNATK